MKFPVLFPVSREFSAQRRVRDRLAPPPTSPSLQRSSCRAPRSPQQSPLIRGVCASAGLDRAPETALIRQRRWLIARLSLPPCSTVPFGQRRRDPLKTMVVLAPTGRAAARDMVEEHRIADLDALRQAHDVERSRSSKDRAIPAERARPAQHVERSLKGRRPGAVIDDMHAFATGQTQRLLGEPGP
jgi:hypothetical protein